MKMTVFSQFLSGFYITSAALDICNEVHLYGFWPFTMSTRGEKVPYHYYDNAHFAVYHDLTLEYRLLVRMHEMGLIKLQFGPCVVWDQTCHGCTTFAVA